MYGLLSLSVRLVSALQASSQPSKRAKRAMVDYAVLSWRPLGPQPTAERVECSEANDIAALTSPFSHMLHRYSRNNEFSH
jgi:hypothetical protein